MTRTVGTTIRGLRAPMIKQGDDIVQIAVATLLRAANHEGFKVKDHDVLALTESIVARAQGNYASIDAIASDTRRHFAEGVVGILFPIMSRNRFMSILRGFARGADELVIQLSYPSDEVGNHLITDEKLFESGVNPYTDQLTAQEFTEKFGKTAHPFTGVDYIELYQQICEEEQTPVTILLSNNPTHLLDYTDQIIACDIHSRHQTKKILQKAGAHNIYDLTDFLTESIDGSGYNPEYGLLGANNASDDQIKLFPAGSQEVVEQIQSKVYEETGRLIEVMVYGDGAFKDPVGKIWELADPVVSPGFTKGLEGTPNEIKLKYLADNDYADLSGEELEKAIAQSIQKKDRSAKDTKAKLGTTPRQLTDLLGSLADLTSGSGDKGTPIIYIQGYFDDYTAE